jgi:hypothetical protein
VPETGAGAGAGAGAGVVADGADGVAALDRDAAFGRAAGGVAEARAAGATRGVGALFAPEVVGGPAASRCAPATGAGFDGERPAAHEAPMATALVMPTMTDVVFLTS